MLSGPRLRRWPADAAHGHAALSQLARRAGVAGTCVIRTTGGVALNNDEMGEVKWDRWLQN
jgi:hypothetical protein